MTYYINKWILHCHKPLLNFQCSEKADSDNCCQCSCCFCREEGFWRSLLCHLLMSATVYIQRVYSDVIYMPYKSLVKWTVPWCLYIEVCTLHHNRFESILPPWKKPFILQHSPPVPRSLAGTGLLSVSMDLLLPDVSCAWDRPIRGLLRLFPSLIIMFSGFIHVLVWTVLHVLLWPKNTPLRGYTLSFLHSSVGRLGFSCVDRHSQFSGGYSWGRNAGSRGNSMSNILRSCWAVLKAAAPFTHLPAYVRVSHIPTNSHYSLLIYFLIGAIIAGGILLWLWFAFSWRLMILNILCACRPLVNLYRNVCANPLPIFKWGYFSLSLSLFFFTEL